MDLIGIEPMTSSMPFEITYVESMTYWAIEGNKKAHKEHCAQEKVPQLCPRFDPPFLGKRSRRGSGQAFNP